MSHQTDIDHAVNAVGLQACVNYMVEQYGAAIIFEALSTYASDQFVKTQAHSDERHAWLSIGSAVDRAHVIAEENEV
jgi:hypothetical protein